MDISIFSSIVLPKVNSVRYVFTSNSNKLPVTKKIDSTGPNTPPKLKYFLEYSYYDFDNFDSSEYTGEVFNDFSSLFIIKLALPKEVSYALLKYNNITVAKVNLTKVREHTYNSIASIYRDTATESEKSEMELKIHLTNYSNPHSDQVIDTFSKIPTGAILTRNLVNYSSERYLSAPFGKFILTEDGSKYYMGAFTDTLLGV